MDKDKLMQQAKDTKYIPGFYNYCDRWCERCEFTSRCLNCTLVEEEFDDFEEIDIQNREFRRKFEKVLQCTWDLIEEMAQKMGIKVDFIEDENCSNDGQLASNDKVKRA